MFDVAQPFGGRVGEAGADPERRPELAAGVNLKALSTFIGHARIAITLDLYGHLLPGSEDEAAGLLDTYLGAAG